MDGYTTGKAGGGVTQQLASIPTAYQNDALELARAQRLAEMLGSTETPQGQMISGRFVAPSWSQNLAKLAQTGLSAYYGDQAEKQNIALAKKIREGESSALADYMTQLKGRPAIQQQTELAGPYGQGVGQAGANVPQPMATKDIPAVEANPFLANMNASMNDMLPSWMRQHAMKEVTKGPEWKEITQVNKQTGETEIWRYDANSQKPRDTLQFLGTSKAALSPSELLHLNDKGIGTGPFGNPYGSGNAPAGGGAPAGGSMPVAGAPAGGQPNAVFKPVSATNATSQDFVKVYGYDPFKPPPMPPQPSPEAARDWQKNAYKPLEGTAGQKVDGAKMYYNALEKYNNYVANLTPADLTKPSVRQMLTSLHATVKLTGKEANNLGVLNGGDERILEEVIPNYKDIFVTKENLKKMIQGQKEFASDIIVQAYGTQQKVVPENMRKYFAVPKVEAVPQVDIKTYLKEKNIPYDPSYEYKVNPDGSVDQRKKR
jgi:hypothetical protein